MHYTFFLTVSTFLLDNSFAIKAVAKIQWNRELVSQSLGQGSPVIVAAGSSLDAQAMTLNKIVL